MNTITERFTIQALGYDKEQVDGYIQKLTDEYYRLQSQFAELAAKAESQERQPAANMEAISKALVHAETMAMQIIADANSEAARIVGEAHMELQKMQQEKVAATAEISSLMNRLQGVLPAAV